MLLTTECENYLTRTAAASPEDQPRSKHARIGSDSSSSSLWSLFGEMLDEADEANSEGSNSGYTAEMMVEMYLKECIQPRHTDPLQYWKSKKVIWLPLADLACKYLSIPPSSAASERLFSSAADVTSQERNRLLPEKAEMLLFLKKNMQVLENFSTEL